MKADDRWGQELFKPFKPLAARSAWENRASWGDAACRMPQLLTRTKELGRIWPGGKTQHVENYTSSWSTGYWILSQRQLHCNEAVIPCHFRSTPRMLRSKICLILCSSYNNETPRRGDLAVWICLFPTQIMAPALSFPVLLQTNPKQDKQVEISDQEHSNSILRPDSSSYWNPALPLDMIPKRVKSEARCQGPAVGKKQQGWCYIHPKNEHRGLENPLGCSKRTAPITAACPSRTAIPSSKGMTGGLRIKDHRSPAAPLTS